MAFTTPNVGWLLKQNKRYAPLLDTMLKLAPIPIAIGAVLALPMLFIFNGYLGQLNQPAIPVSQAGDWVFLLLFSILASVTFAVIVLMPAAWTTLVRWNAPSLSPKRIKSACGATALATVGCLTVILSLWPGAPIAALVVATVVGGLAGGLFVKGGLTDRSDFLPACAGFALSALLVIIWFASLWLLLGPLVEAFVQDWPVLTLIGMITLLLLMLGTSIVKPVIGILVGTVVIGSWLSAQVSPDGGTMIASALYSANLGGGRPAHGPQPRLLGEICNLGVDGRQVLYFEGKGCSRGAMFRRLSELKGKDSLSRRRQIRLWDTVVKRHLA